MDVLKLRLLCQLLVGSDRSTRSSTFLPQALDLYSSLLVTRVASEIPKLVVAFKNHLYLQLSGRNPSAHFVAIDRLDSSHEKRLSS